MASLRDLMLSYLGLYRYNSDNNSLSIGFSPEFLTFPENQQQKIFDDLITVLVNDTNAIEGVKKIFEEHLTAAYETFLELESVYKNNSVRLEYYPFFIYRPVLFLYHTLNVQRFLFKNNELSKPVSSISFHRFSNSTPDSILFLLLLNKTEHFLKPPATEKTFRDGFLGFLHVGDIRISNLQETVAEEKIDAKYLIKFENYYLLNYKFQNENYNLDELYNDQTISHSIKTVILKQKTYYETIIAEPDITLKQAVCVITNEDQEFTSIFFNKNNIEKFITKQCALDQTDKEYQTLIDVCFTISCLKSFVFTLILVLRKAQKNSVKNKSIADLEAFVYKAKNDIKSLQYYLNEYIRTKQSDGIEKINLRYTTEAFLHKNNRFVKQIIKYFSEFYLEKLYNLSRSVNNEIRNNTIENFSRIFYNHLPDRLNNIADFNYQTEISDKIKNILISENPNAEPTRISEEKTLFTTAYALTVNGNEPNETANTFQQKLTTFIKRKTNYNEWLTLALTKALTTYFYYQVFTNEAFQQDLVNGLMRAGLSARFIAHSFYKVFADDPNKGPKKHIRTNKVRYSLFLLEDQVRYCAVKLGYDPYDPAVNIGIVNSTQVAHANATEDLAPSENTIRQAVNREVARALEKKKEMALKEEALIFNWLKTGKDLHSAFFEKYEHILPKLPAHLAEGKYRVLDSKDDAKFIIKWSIEKNTCLLNTIKNTFNLSVALTVEKDDEILRVIAFKHNSFDSVIDFKKAFKVNNDQYEPIPYEQLEDIFKNLNAEKLLKTPTSELVSIKLSYLHLLSRHYCTNYNNQPDDKLSEILINKLYPSDYDALNIAIIFNKVTKEIGAPVMFKTLNTYIGCIDPDKLYLVKTSM